MNARSQLEQDMFILLERNVIRFIYFIDVSVKNLSGSLWGFIVNSVKCHAFIRFVYFT